MSERAEHEAGGLWDKLRRRKVVQWGIAYGVDAWGFLQGLEYVGEAFGWPGQLRQIAILALLVGLPVVLVVAWYHGWTSPATPTPRRCAARSTACYTSATRSRTPRSRPSAVPLLAIEPPRLRDPL